MPGTKTTRRRRKGRGEGRADSVYTPEGVMRSFGLGKMSLLEARRSGMVKMYHRGGRGFYHGKEIIDWILAGPTKLNRDV
jgi:ribosomal protein S14